MKKISELLDECKYMPKEFQDFHDQKDLFKLIFSKCDLHEEIKHISWIHAHIYTVDIFLWFMAKRGYTLQKARHKIDFNNVQEEISAMRKGNSQKFASLIQGNINNHS